MNIFFKRVATGPLQERGNAQAAPQTFGFGFGFALGKARPIGFFQGLVHDHFKCACVVDLAHWVFVGHLRSLNEITTAQLHTVNAAYTRGFIDQTFDVVDGLGPACTTVGACAGGVGHDTCEMVVNGLDVVHATLNPRSNQHLNGQARHGGVGANIGQRFDAQAQNFAVTGQSQRRFGFDVAAMRAA